MNKVKRTLERYNEGFSILEVVLAIAILGILCFPIYGYFTNTSQFNADAKKKQLVTHSAQTVMEEVVAVGSYEGYAELCNKPVGDPDYGEYEDLTSYPIGPADDEIYYFKRPVGANGNEYTAYIEMDYKEYTPDDVSTPIGIQYNSYEKPEVKSLNPSKTVIAMEKNQNKDAISYFVGRGEAKADVEANMKRTAKLSLRELTPFSVDRLYVKMVYVYHYNGKDYETPDTLFDGIMNKKDFNSVYWFYTVWNSDKDIIEVDDQLDPLPTEEDAVMVNYGISIIKQEGVDSTDPNYKVQINYKSGSNEELFISNVYTNLELDKVEGYSNNIMELVPLEQVKRISRVRVAVFQNAMANFDTNPSKAFERESKPLVLIDSAKGE